MALSSVLYSQQFRAWVSRPLRRWIDQTRCHTQRNIRGQPGVGRCGEVSGSQVRLLINTQEEFESSCQERHILSCISVRLACVQNSASACVQRARGVRARVQPASPQTKTGAEASR